MRIFVDDELDAAYRQDGYVVVRLMESDQAAEIDAAARRHLPRDLPPHENVTFISYGQPELQWIDDLVGRAVDEALVPLLDDMGAGRSGTGDEQLSLQLPGHRSRVQARRI